MQEDRSRELVKKAMILEADRRRDEKIIHQGQVELMKKYQKERDEENTARRLGQVRLACKIPQWVSTLKGDYDLMPWFDPCPDGCEEVRWEEDPGVPGLCVREPGGT
jgi:hypothetical protein